MKSNTDFDYICDMSREIGSHFPMIGNYENYISSLKDKDILTQAACISKLHKSGKSKHIEKIKDIKQQCEQLISKILWHSDPDQKLMLGRMLIKLLENALEYLRSYKETPN